MNRTLVTLCPACGAQVTFSSGSSALAVCAYCTSTLLRKGDVLENLGRMAELIDDHSPLQIGVRGVHRSVAFGLIGRLQYRHAAGTWNEWRALFDDGTERWLSEDNGRFVMMSAPVPVEAPPFDSLQPDQPLRLKGIPFTVANRESATVVAGQGELPFRVGGGYDAPVVDLRDPKGRIATLDYSDFAAPGPVQALLYLGEPVALADLKLDGLRTELQRVVATEPFACPSCGAPVQATLASTKSLTCAACASCLDLTGGTAGRIAFARQASRVKPRIPIGATGRLDGIDWTLVGFQRRAGRSGEDTFHWDEYLLHAPMHGFRFLVDDDGHWSLAEVLQQAVAAGPALGGRPTALHDGRTFDHFARCQASVDYVEGEFYWRVAQGDTTMNDDYIAPPLGLSKEVSGNEVTWSLARHLDIAELRAAFAQARDLPAPDGPGSLAPLAPGLRRRYWQMSLVVLGLLFALQIVAVVAGSTRVLVAERPLDFRSPLPGDHLIDVVGSRKANVIVQTEGGIRNDWYAVEVELASRDQPGVVHAASREVAYYEGQDSDGHWSEGSTRERLVFKVPPGKYLVRVSGEHNPQGAQPFANYSVTQTTRPGWLPFWLGCLVLGIWNLIGVIGCPDPEARRWADSRYGRPPLRLRKPGAARPPTGTGRLPGGSPAGSPGGKPPPAAGR